jgi:hypothetical protein
MASTLCDREAALSATPQAQTAAVRETPREWHRLTPETIVFASEDEMRFGARSYTPQQRVTIDLAVVSRAELSAPRLRRD